MKESKRQLEGFLATKLPTLLLIVGAISLLIGFRLGSSHKHDLYFSYLTNYAFFWSLTLGALFFVMIQFLVRAGWSVVVRRIAENIVKNIGFIALAFIPIIFGMHELYHWTHADALAHDELLKHKSAYLNTGFFIIRTVIYFAIWIVLSLIFYKNSVKQDESGDKNITLKLQRLATVGVILFALSLSFASFDWYMSLEPHWFSTIFGVYIFAGAVMSVHALISVIAQILRTYGFLKEEINIEHYHDLGKLIYGFNIFWAYIAFSQYILIWYANIPEETFWFANRWVGSWKTFSLVLIIGHFVLPLFIFMPRYMKRNLKIHFVIAIWMLAMHWVDLAWIIQPTGHKEGFHFSIYDVLTFLGLGGLFFGLLLKRMAKVPLLPVKDPRLPESLNFKNH